MPGVRTGRKTDLRQDVDALTKAVASVRTTVEDILTVINGQLRDSREAVRMLEGLGGRPPLRVVEVLTGFDQLMGRGGKRLAIHWTPVGLIITENGKQYVTNSYMHSVAVTGPVGRFGG